MFANNIKKTDFAAHSFGKYREENNFLIVKLNNVLKKIKKHQELNTHERKDIVGINFFGLNPNDIRQIFDSLEINAEDIVKLIEKLIKNLENEKEELDKHFGKLNHNEIENINYLETLLIRYNQDQYDMIQQLNVYIPNLIELSEKLIGVELDTLKEAADNFISLFKNLTYALLHKADKGHLYYITTQTLQLLGEYKNKYQQDFLNSINDIRAKNFAENFFKLGSQFSKDLNKKLQDAKLTDKDSYNDIKDDDEKFAKFMRNTLEILFRGIEIPTEEENKTKDPESLIKKIIDLKSNFKDLEKEFKEWYIKLQRKINADYNLERGKDLDNFYIIGITGLEENTTTFKTFKEKYLKEEKKDIVEYVVDYMEQLYKAGKDKKPYSNFIDENRINIKKKDEESDENNDDALKEWESISQKLKDKLKEYFNSLDIDTLETSISNINNEQIYHGDAIETINKTIMDILKPFLFEKYKKDEDKIKFFNNVLLAMNIEETPVLLLERLVSSVQIMYNKLSKIKSTGISNLDKPILLQLGNEIVTKLKQIFKK